MSKTEIKNLPSLDTKSLSTQNTPSSYRAYLSNEYIDSELTAVNQLYDKLNHTMKLIRLSECRTEAVFVRDKVSGLVRVSAKSCHVRFCPFCSRAKSWRIKKNTTSWLKRCGYPKFITLTLKHSEDFLLEKIDWLYFCFKELRRLKLWRKKIIGGIWFLEIKYTKKGEWHPHIHIVADGRYLSQRKLSKEWERLTSDSPVVDIRAVKDPQKVAEYVGKYATKPCRIKNLELPQRLELYDALRKRRLVGTFGTAFKCRITAKPEFDSTQFTKIGSWSTIVGMQKFDENAFTILEAFLQKKTIGEKVSCDLIDNFILGIPPPDVDIRKYVIKDTILWSIRN